MPRAVIITADDYEDLELFYPYYRLVESGFEVVIAAPEAGEVRGKRGYKVKANARISDIDPTDFDVLVVPGGRAPEKVRLEEGSIRIVREFFSRSKPVATICHGPQVLISAGVVKGRRLTSYWGIKDDVIAAGGEWVDEPVVVDGNLVSSRYPGDIPFWLREFFKVLSNRGLTQPVPIEA